MVCSSTRPDETGTHRTDIHDMTRVSFQEFRVKRLGDIPVASINSGFFNRMGRKQTWGLGQLNPLVRNMQQTDGLFLRRRTSFVLKVIHSKEQGVLGDGP